MGRSVLPPISLPVVTISAPYAGAGPAEIERLVIEPLEDQLASAPALEHIDSTAQNGEAEISVQFRFGSDMATNRANVQQAVDAARANLPADLRAPLLARGAPAEAPVFEEAVSSELIHDGALSNLLDKQVLPAMRAVSGVENVTASGADTLQFVVKPRGGALAALNATMLDVLHAAQAGGDVFPGGVFRSRYAESTIGVDGAATSVQALRDLPLGIGANPSVRLGDAAGVQETYADRSVITRVDGARAIILFVTHAQGANVLQTIAGTRAVLRTLAGRYPMVRFEELRSDEPSANAAVAGVFQTLEEGVALTVVVMLLFLRAWRNALIAAMAIPASLCAAFATMWALGISMNILSLMGLSLTIGILVDDSIVIIEAITRAFVMGVSADEAALAGRRELGGATFAITLVDVAVFAPIAMMSGLVGEFMREFGLVVIIATSFSLLVSLTLTPLLSARWALRAHGAALESSRLPWTLRTKPAQATIFAWHRLRLALGALEVRATAAYADDLLPMVLAHPQIVAIAATVISAASLVPVFSGAVPTEFSPPLNSGVATVTVTLPAGTPLSATDAAVQRMNEALLDDPQAGHVVTISGQAFNGTSNIAASNLAQVSVILTDPNAASDAISEKMKRMTALVPAASITGAGKGMGGAPGVSYTIGGDSPAAAIAAQRIADALRANRYATDVRTSEAGLQPRVQLSVDMERARLLNVSPDDAAQTARIATGGSIAARVRTGWGLEDLLVRADAAQAGDFAALGRAAVRSREGRLVPLEDLVRMTFSRDPAVITREDGARIVTVSANAVENAPISLISTGIAAGLRDSSFLPPGARVEPRGDLKQFFDTAAKIVAALLISTLAVYVILATLYRSYTLPLIIMLTVPLSSSGAFGALLLLNALRVPAQTLNLYSMIGIVMLSGLVAKNGILLVEYAERALRSSADAGQAMVQAAKVRFRPIVMTTLAMIAGMFPLAAGHTVGAQYRRALGTVVIAGLSSSLLLTLFVVPVAYVWYRGGMRSRARRSIPYAVDGREARRGA
jgi:HAE1 family hydrophobic/amphiphilic exporter-1